MNDTKSEMQKDEPFLFQFVEIEERPESRRDEESGPEEEPGPEPTPKGPWGD